MWKGMSYPLRWICGGTDYASSAEKRSMFEVKRCILRCIFAAFWTDALIELAMTHFPQIFRKAQTSAFRSSDQKRGVNQSKRQRSRTGSARGSFQVLRSWSMCSWKYLLVKLVDRQPPYLLSFYWASLQRDVLCRSVSIINSSDFLGRITALRLKSSLSLVVCQRRLAEAAERVKLFQFRPGPQPKLFRCDISTDQIAFLSPNQQCQSTAMKKALRETQTLRAGRVKRSENFRPSADPFLGRRTARI